MGTIIKATCQCGFESKDIFAGGGFANFMTELAAPAFCNKCKSLIVSNYRSKNPKYPKCKGKISFYNDKTLQEGESEEDIFSWSLPNEEGEFRLADTSYLCPKCKEMKMRFMVVGCWD